MRINSFSTLISLLAKDKAGNGRSLSRSASETSSPLEQSNIVPLATSQDADQSIASITTSDEANEAVEFATKGIQMMGQMSLVAQANVSPIKALRLLAE